MDGKQKVIIMCGLPGSGKSTLANEIRKELHCEYVCPDDIRKELTGDTSDQSMNNEVWCKAYERFSKSINHRHNVIFDATNIYAEGRKKLLNLVGHDDDIERICVFVNTPFRDCLKRNGTRERCVPIEVIKRMKKNLEKPYLSEGFDKVIVVFC